MKQILLLAIAALGISPIANGGATSYAGFAVNVASSIIAGGPVGGSSGQVVISYDVRNDPPPPTGVPEPSSYALMTAGLAGLGFLARRRK